MPTTFPEDTTLNEYDLYETAKPYVMPEPPGHEKPQPGQHMHDEEEESIYLDLPPPTKKYLFDWMPHDIIKFEIFPYLDYESRIAVNKCLPPVDRVSTRMKPEQIIKHDLAINTVRLFSIVSNIKNTSSHAARRLKKIIGMFNEFKSYRTATILQHNSKFRKATIEKLNEFIDPKNPDYKLISAYYKRKIILSARETLQFIKKIPFIKEIEINRIVRNQ